MKQTTSHRWVRGLQLLGATVLLGIAFQNCADVKFTPEQLESVSGNPNNPEVICDPFSEGSTCSATSGLLGNVYYLPDAKAGVQEYIDRGTRLDVLVQMVNLNIPERSWSTGFPSGGGLIKAPNGEALIEYFALDLKGYLRLNQNYNSGDYQFAIASDDGAILDIDGKEVVNNDGWHATEWACSSGSINLKQNDIHQVRLRYYQGPRYFIALQVYWRPASESNKPCNAQGGWSIVPGELLYH